MYSGGFVNAGDGGAGEEVPRTLAVTWLELPRQWVRIGRPTERTLKRLLVGSCLR